VEQEKGEKAKMETPIGAGAATTFVIARFLKLIIAF
jgi:hypothetical protein